MKNKNVIIALIFTAFMVGCKDKKQETPTINNPSTDLATFFENNGAKKQTFTINVDNGISMITGAKGSTVSFPEDAFVDADGLPVSGDITIDLVEVLSKEDMVLSDKPTTSNGAVLVSGGEIFIGASANGQELRLKENTSILISIEPEVIDPEMSLFVQDTDSSDQFDWTPVPNIVQSQSPIVLTDTTGGWGSNSETYFYYDPSKYIFKIAQLGWINCDYFYNRKKTSLTITCPKVKNNSNLRGYLVFKNINSAVSLYADYSQVGLIRDNYAPIGDEVDLIVFYFEDGKEYVGVNSFIITENLELSVDLVETSEADIVALVKNKF